MRNYPDSSPATVPAAGLARRPPVAAVFALVLVAAALLYGPITQPAGYHAFADQRTLFGIAHFADVVSNLGFLLVGLWGLSRRGTLEHTIFCAAIALTALGSTWYHLAPDDQRLIWDRMPIALACAALLAASLRDGYRMRAALLPLMCCGIASVLWWSYSGDLRPYLLLQLAPLVLIPALQWESRASIASRKAFALAILLYVLAKVCELADAAVFDALDLVSGHTVKHLLATAAAWVLVKQGRIDVDADAFRKRTNRVSSVSLH